MDCTIEQSTFAGKILRFIDTLRHESLALPAGYRIVNPFVGEQKERVQKITAAFYHQYYNDFYTRRMILGSSPARRGSAVTGVPFEDAGRLQKETGILMEGFSINPSSSGFLYEVMQAYGGRKKFYARFYMNFVCPLGVVKTNAKGNEVNCNYYQDKKLQESLRPFITGAIRRQIDFGIDTSVCYCIGSGENYHFLSQLNQEHRFFGRIVPLEHPRFIMQYNAKRKWEFIEKYMNALRQTR